MISTPQPALPDGPVLRASCKAMAVLDALLSPEWIYRYYSYNSAWSPDEEFFEMRNGEGDQLLILFRAEGTVINGFSLTAGAADQGELAEALPPAFHEFMFGEPVRSAGTTFCLWKYKDEPWKTGPAGLQQDYSAELLSPLDGNPRTYQEWATGYFDGYDRSRGIPLSTVEEIYRGEPLTREMVESVIPAYDDWEQLAAELNEISYPYHINT